MMVLSREGRRGRGREGLSMSYCLVVAPHGDFLDGGDNFSGLGFLRMIGRVMGGMR